MSRKPPSKLKEAKKIDDTDEGLIFTARGQIIPYKDLETLLRKEQIVFIEGLKRQTAHQAAIRISKRFGFKVKAFSSTYQKVAGYSFMIIKDEK